MTRVHCACSSPSCQIAIRCDQNVQGGGQVLWYTDRHGRDYPMLLETRNLLALIRELTSVLHVRWDEEHAGLTTIWP